MKTQEMRSRITSGGLDRAFDYLYSEKAPLQRERYEAAVGEFEKLFGAGREVGLFSAPGRTEVGGNHTDHQQGRVLAAGVNLDVIAVAGRNDDNVIRIQSAGFPMDTIDLSDVSVRECEKNTAASLIRGVAAKFAALGYRIGGFDAYTTSSVLKGSGLSSSAAFEVLLGAILNQLYNGGAVSAVEVAKIAQYAENVYFGKPSGLMDQMASSVGSVITIDFADTENPIIEKMDFDMDAMGCALCIVDVGGNHADLTSEYASIPAEMKQVAGFFGRDVLRGVSYRELIANAPLLRAQFGDRAFLRAVHFVKENERVGAIVNALKDKDYPLFLHLVTESGGSSYRYLQNVYANCDPKEQSMAVALEMAEDLLNGRGAYRVHGGGFGGTTQNFVPLDLLEEFRAGIESVFGEGSCHVLSIRPFGGIQIL